MSYTEINIHLVVNRVLRALFDAFALNFAFCLAISIHYLTFIVRDFGGKFSWDFYIKGVGDSIVLWSAYSPFYTPLAIGVFWVFRFYSSYTFRRYREKIFCFIVGVILANLLLLTMMYLSFEPNPFPRGALGLYLLFTLIFCVGARVLRPVIGLVVSYLNTPEGKDHFVKKVLVIGGGGYIGTVLCQFLLRKGYQVRVLDLLIFGEGPVLDILSDKNAELFRGDFRNVADLALALEGVDAVVHLGGLVGDPACAVDEDLTIDVNLAATQVLGDLCRARGIRRFIFASTCSVYGVSEELLNERSRLNPVSLYAKSKIDSESMLRELTSFGFRPTILRFATVFGLSPRPRFDLVVNTFVAQALKKKSIEVFGGNQWRPFVHVFDVARAIEICLRSPLRLVGGEVFNVGDNSLNYTISQVAEHVSAVIPDVMVHNRGDIPDPRNYRVSFDKIARVLSFRCQMNLEKGIYELVHALKNFGELDISLDLYSNFAQTQSLVASHNPVAQNKLHKADLFSARTELISKKAG